MDQPYLPSFCKFSLSWLFWAPAHHPLYSLFNKSKLSSVHTWTLSIAVGYYGLNSLLTTLTSVSFVNLGRDVIKLRILRRGDYPEWSSVVIGRSCPWWTWIVGEGGSSPWRRTWQRRVLSCGQYIVLVPYSCWLTDCWVNGQETGSL